MQILKEDLHQTRLRLAKAQKKLVDAVKSANETQKYEMQILKEDLHQTRLDLAKTQKKLADAEASIQVVKHTRAWPSAPGYGGVMNRVVAVSQLHAV
mmetsp:Transcript_40239/g.97148  ORF Transcript_40239/g.97148 Transcript_40239/m.97148 type:complete len:97 (-) Transcript_40239:1364-1654(-)